MKKIIVFMLVALCTISISACNKKTEPSSNDKVKQTKTITTEPTSITVDFKHNTYYDEENDLNFHYPVMFSDKGITDEGGEITFSSNKDGSSLEYFTIPNSYNQTAENFDYMIPDVRKVLDNNVVIGYGEAVDIDTLETSQYAGYWVVDKDIIIFAYLECSSKEEAKDWYTAFENNAIYVERFNSNSNTEMDEDTATNILIDALGDKIQGDTAVLSTGEDVINGIKAYTFAVGKNTPEKFTAEQHYAVDIDGTIYSLDIINNEYIPYDANDNTNSEKSDVWISFATQEYIGDNIAEIPYFNYNNNSNAEVDSINRIINQGIGKKYFDFDTSDENNWIEIKSYPFTSENYIQVVMTSIVYPTYGTDGDLSSVNYDKNTNKLITNEDIMNKINMTKEQIDNEIYDLFEPSFEGDYISDIHLAGFVIQDTPQETVQLLLEVTTNNQEADPWKSFYAYIPDTSELYQINNYCLFDPYDMDQMDPPLSYQMSEGN